MHNKTTYRRNPHYVQNANPSNQIHRKPRIETLRTAKTPRSKGQRYCTGSRTKRPRGIPRGRSAVLGDLDFPCRLLPRRDLAVPHYTTARGGAVTRLGWGRRGVGAEHSTRGRRGAAIWGRRWLLSAVGPPALRDLCGEREMDTRGRYLWAFGLHWSSRSDQRCLQHLG